MPFHFGGFWQGKDLRDKYPKGNDPIVLGEASNMCGTYGYDVGHADAGNQSHAVPHRGGLKAPVREN